MKPSLIATMLMGLLLGACSVVSTTSDGPFFLVQAEVSSLDTAVVLGAARPDPGDRVWAVRWEDLEYRIVLRNQSDDTLTEVETRILPSDAIRELYDGNDPFAESDGLPDHYRGWARALDVTPDEEVEIRRSIITYAHDSQGAHKIRSPLTGEKAQRLAQIANQVTLQVRWNGGFQQFSLPELGVQVSPRLDPPIPGKEQAVQVAMRTAACESPGLPGGQESRTARTRLMTLGQYEERYTSEQSAMDRERQVWVVQVEEPSGSATGTPGRALREHQYGIVVVEAETGHVLASTCRAQPIFLRFEPSLPFPIGDVPDLPPRGVAEVAEPDAAPAVSRQQAVQRFQDLLSGPRPTGGRGYTIPDPPVEIDATLVRYTEDRNRYAQDRLSWFLVVRAPMRLLGCGPVPWEGDGPQPTCWSPATYTFIDAQTGDMYGGGQVGRVGPTMTPEEFSEVDQFAQAYSWSSLWSAIDQSNGQRLPPEALARLRNWPKGTPRPPLPTPVPPRPGAGPPTPTPTPAPTPTPLVVAPARLLPAAVPTEELTSRASSIARWQPDLKGGFAAFALLEGEHQGYALAASGNEVHLLDVREPGALRLLEMVLTAPAPVAAMQTSGTLLAMLVEGDNPGLLLYDIQDPRDPAPLGTYRGTFERLDLADGHAYLAAGDDGLHIVDVSRPRRPHLVANIPVWTEEERRDHGGGSSAIIRRTASIRDVRVAGGLAYVAAYQMGLVVFDISNPAAPKRIGQFRTPGYARRVALGDGYAFVVNNVVTPFTIWIVDIRDPKDPRPVGHHQDRSVNGGVQQIEAAGDRAYFLASSGGWGGANWMLGVLDVSTPQAPVLLTRYWRSGYAGEMELRGDQIFLTDSGGIAVLDVRQAEPALLSRLLAGGGPRTIHIRDPYAFLFTSSGLHVVDLTATGNPREVATLDLDGKGPSRVEGDTAYFFVGRDHQRPLDLSDPANPRWGEPVPQQSVSRGQAAIGPYAYWYSVTGHHQRWSVLKVYVYEEGESREVGQVPLASGHFCCGAAITVAGKYIYVAGGQALYILDASDPAAPRVVAKKPLVAEGRGHPFIRVHEGKAYVLQGGLWVLDLADPEAPAAVAYHPTEARTLAVVDKTVYLLGPGAELEVIKLAEPAR